VSKVKKIIAILGLSLLVSFSFFYPEFGEVEASVRSEVTLTFSQTTDTEGEISVRLGSNTSRVLLPDGSSTTSNTTFVVRENRIYDFVSYNSNNRPTQHHIEVTELDVDPAPLTTANGLTIKLNVEALDTISDVKDFRYRLESSSRWSSRIAYNPAIAQEITIPDPRDGSYVDDEAVVVQVRDHANNLTEVKTEFRIDNYHPVIKSDDSRIYTNDSTITLPLTVESYFKIPEKLIVEEGSKERTYQLEDYNPVQTSLQRRPDLFLLDYEDQINYTVDTTFEGPRDVVYNVIKSYTDFKGNTRHLPSIEASNHRVEVVFDVTKPTGNIEIQSDDNGEVLTHDVLIDLSFYDQYGVDSVRVYEGSNEYILTDSEVRAGRLTDLPWTLGGSNRKVYMDVTDRAGNVSTFESNEVVISNIYVSGFELTDVVNPIVYREEQPFVKKVWPYDGSTVSMLPGGNFDFSIYYNLTDVEPDPEVFFISGKYQITIIDDGEVKYQSDEIQYKTDDIPVGERFDNQNEYGDEGFATTFTLPNVDINDEPFNRTAKVSLTSEITRERYEDGQVLTTTFESDLSDYGSLIGTFDHNEPSDSVSIDDLIRFNHRH